MNTSPSSQYMSSLFSGKHRESDPSHILHAELLSYPLINPLIYPVIYPLADNIEYPNVNSTVLKTHLCLPQLKF